MIEVNAQDSKAKHRIATQLRSKLCNCIFICIGTERVLADSIGPKVGTLLNQNMASSLFVYGMENHNITAENLQAMVELIKRLHPNKKIAVVDAAVGETNQIGNVQITERAIMPGAATNKRLGAVGDVSIVGIVAHKNMQDFYAPTVEKQLLVQSLAQFIATIILMATNQ